MTAAAYANAESAIAQELVRLDGLYAARDILREIGSLEQAVNESRARAVSARADEAAAQDELKSTLQKVVDAQTAAATEIAEAQNSVAAVRARAAADADAIRAEATAAAEAIVASAEAATADSRRRAQILNEAIAQTTPA